jgi:hypothetical protein
VPTGRRRGQHDVVEQRQALDGGAGADRQPTLAGGPEGDEGRAVVPVAEPLDPPGGGVELVDGRHSPGIRCEPGQQPAEWRLEVGEVGEVAVPPAVGKVAEQPACAVQPGAPLVQVAAESQVDGEVERISRSALRTSAGEGLRRKGADARRRPGTRDVAAAG